jgi:hypothetical protein
MLEPDDGSPFPASPVENVTISPTAPDSRSPKSTQMPSNQATGDSAVRQIRKTLEATGDLKPQLQNQASETFMIPPSSLEEAQISSEDLDITHSFDEPEEDSLDLDSDPNSLDLGDGLLDDLDDE